MKRINTAKEEKRTNRRLRGTLDERRRELEELNVRATGEIDTLKGRANSLESFRDREAGFAPNIISGGNISNNTFVPNTITRTFARDSMRSAEVDYVFENLSILPGKLQNVPAGKLPNLLDMNGNFTYNRMGGKHNNQHHEVNYAAAGHSHSISFKDFPVAERGNILLHKNQIEAHLASLSSSYGSAATAQRINDLIGAVVTLFHMASDDPDMDASELDKRIFADAEFRHVKREEQGEEQSLSSFYHRFQNGAFSGVYPNQIFPVAREVAGGSGVTSLTIRRPRGTINDTAASVDLLLTAIAHSSSASVTPPSGWTLITSATKSSAGKTLSVFRKRSEAHPRQAAGNPDERPENYTFTFSTATDAAASVSAYAKVLQSGNPVFSSAKNETAPTNSSEISSPSVGGTNGGMLIEVVAAFESETVERSFEKPASMRLRSVARSREGTTEEAVPRTYLRTADELLFSSAQTQGRSSTQDTPVGEYVSVSLVLTPHAT